MPSGLAEYQTKHHNYNCFPNNSSENEQLHNRNTHWLFVSTLTLIPERFINQSCGLSTLQLSSNGLHLALGMRDPLKRNLATAYFSKQGKVPVIGFIGASETGSLGFTQRLMSGKINTSFTVPAETP